MQFYKMHPIFNANIIRRLWKYIACNRHLHIIDQDCSTEKYLICRCCDLIVDRRIINNK